MRRALSTPLFAALLATFAEVSPALSDDAPVLPATILAATSTGYWEDSHAAGSFAQPAASTPDAASRHGYYKLYAVRQIDRTSKVYLQQMLSTEDGPQVVSTTELSEITALRGYVTDIQPENPGGIIHEPGLFATIFIKRDIDGDAEPWIVSRDDLGEVTVEKAPSD